LAKLYGFALYLKFYYENTKPIAEDAGAFRDNLKQGLPADLTASQCLYYAGLIKVRGRETLSQTIYPAPQRVRIVSFLQEGSRLAFTDGVAQPSLKDLANGKDVNTETNSVDFDIFKEFSLDGLLYGELQGEVAYEVRSVYCRKVFFLPWRTY